MRTGLEPHALKAVGPKRALSQRISFSVRSETWVEADRDTGQGVRGTASRRRHASESTSATGSDCGGCMPGAGSRGVGPRDGEPSGSIGVRVHDPQSLSLEYSVIEDGHRRSANQAITVVRLPCRYGGSRAMFQCPVCWCRCMLLYMRASRFACRQCQRVAYSSQSEDLMGRAWRKQQKAEAKLGEHWQRPRGMRTATYERLMQSIWDCEEERDATLWKTFARLGLSLD